MKLSISISLSSLASLMLLLPILFAGPAMADFNAPASSEHTFRQVGQTIMGLPLEDAVPGKHVEFGSVVRLSKDGMRMAVAASPNADHDGQVFVYERDDTTVDEDIAQATWRPIFELEGEEDDAIGANIALSKDGNFLAIRRGKEVDVYLHNAISQEFELGPSPITSTFANETCTWGNGLSLGQTSTGSVTFLLISCESYKKARGKVDVFLFDSDNHAWESVATLKAPTPVIGNRFGWETSVLVRDSQQNAITVAVSSPNDNEKTGLVQAFRVFPKAGVSRQIGEDLTGQATGDVFGFSLDMSLSGASAGNPALVVGAPKCSSDVAVAAGCVSVYHLNAGDAGDEAWNAVGDPFYGLEANDRLGRSVAITLDGRRFGASSMRYQWQQGQVRLFEWNALTSDYEHIGDLVGDTRMSRWGESIAMNEYGSMIASGALRSKTESGESVGSVQVWLDDSPFCSHPAGDATVEDLFLTRRVCRQAAIDPLECASAKCVWADNLPKAITPAPSSAPSSAPTYPLSFSDEDWFDLSNDENNVTAAPSLDVSEGAEWNDITEEPTTSDSTDAPTASPTGTPSEENDGQSSDPPAAGIASAASFGLLAAGGAGMYKKFFCKKDEQEEEQEGDDEADIV